MAAFIYIIPQQGNAIPAFARKYGFNCNMCHTSFTKLNDFGQRFRNHGYQIPGQEGGEKNVFETAPPLALRTMVGHKIYSSDQTTTSGFNYFGLDLLAAGVLHKNISFLLIYTPRVDEPGADYTGADPSQPAALESANIVFSNILEKYTNVRVGRFEPAYHLISSKRSYYILSDYEVYGFQSPSNGFVFDDNQFGFEATGFYPIGFSYGLGLVNGTGASPDNNKQKDVYLAMSQVIGRGEGQSAGQRIGVFGYYGWQPTVFPGGAMSPDGEIAGRGNKTFMRLGGDLSLNWKTLNLRAFFMQGKDNKDLNNFDPTKEYSYTGGFAELDYAGCLNNRVLFSALYNWVSPPTENEEAKIVGYSVLARYYFGDWTAVNVALHAEYAHREVGKTDPAKEDRIGLLLDFDF